MCSWTCLGTCTCSRSKKKKCCIPLRQTRQQFQKHHPGQEKFIIFVLKLQSILICFQESIDLPFGCMYGRQKLSVLSGILFIFFLHCFALLCIMQCPDRLAGDRQQMSIDGYAVAAQTQVHPVLAHLLPLGNKFLPESERVSALFFFFTYLLTYLFFLYTLYLYNSWRSAAVFSQEPRRRRRSRGAVQQLCALLFLCWVTEQRLHMGQNNTA